MSKFDDKIEEIMEACGSAHNLTDGMKKALFSNSGLGYKEVKKECDKCGFLVPKYKGRYPHSCPMCGDPIDDRDKEVYTGDDDLSETDYEMDENVMDIVPVVSEGFSDAMMAAFEDNMEDDKIAKKCEDCGFAIPKYKGAYPKRCPKCNAENDSVITEKFEMTPRLAGHLNNLNAYHERSMPIPPGVTKELLDKGFDIKGIENPKEIFDIVGQHFGISSKTHGKWKKKYSVSPVFKKK
jgi:Zn finger protein HypA/HybF involved in hydrogenase expression